MAANEQQHMEMPPGFPELWEGLTRARMDIAELKGMVKMHFTDSSHHTPPCSTASGLQKTLHAAMGAAIISLLSAVATPGSASSPGTRSPATRSRWSRK